QNVLPIQVFRTTGTGLRKRKNRLRFLEIRKLTGTDFYLGIKLLIPKFRQNFMFILIIALITALSYTGQSSMKLIEENSYHYYRNLMEGFDAYGEICPEESLVPDRIIEMKEEMTEELKEASVQCCIIIGRFWGDMYGEDSLEAVEETYEYDNEYERYKVPYGFYVTDITEFMSAFRGEYMKNWNDIPKGQRMVVTDKTAEYLGYKLGDIVTLGTCGLDGKKEFTVAGIVKLHNFGMEPDGIILDIGNLAYMKEKNNDYYDAYFYMNGKREQLEEVLNQLGQEEEDFEWLIYEQIIEEGNTVTTQRMAMIRMVMIFLAIVAGIGWLNSAKGLLLARKEEYKVLRMLGATRKNVRKISWMQVWSYMLSGIILGIVMGLTTVYLLFRNEVHENVTISIYWENIAGIALFLFALSLLLKPTIKKLSL
ncbi:MAG: FtsX-like permease family protein, partial [Lachnospiraceae bacterium]|nr:FtsX-like permease family protein [Lachnospiraceae bacterium]